MSGKIIEGLTTGIKAKVLYSIPATVSSRGYITFYIKYVESGDTTSDVTTKKFQNNEQLIVEDEITFGNSLIEVGSPFAQMLPVNAALRLDPLLISVKVSTSSVVTLLIFSLNISSLNSTTTTQVTELDLKLANQLSHLRMIRHLRTMPLVRPTTLLLVVTDSESRHNLLRSSIDDDTDKNFIELLRIRNSTVENFVDRTEYNEIEKSIARRTYETHGDYVVDTFDVRAREHLNDHFNNGVYLPGQPVLRDKQHLRTSLLLKLDLVKHM